MEEGRFPTIESLVVGDKAKRAFDVGRDKFPVAANSGHNDDATFLSLKLLDAADGDVQELRVSPE